MGLPASAQQLLREAAEAAFKASTGSHTTARIQHLVSHGEVVGLEDQTDKHKSLIVGGTVAQNENGSNNFNKIQIQETYGTPDQAPMAGFTSVANEFTVGSIVTQSSNVTYSSTSDAVDAITVTIRFPAGIYRISDSGKQKTKQIQFNIYHKLAAGDWVLQVAFDEELKKITVSDIDFLIPRPAGAGNWQVMVDRITADDSESTELSQMIFQFATEIQNVSLPYANLALIGITTTTEQVGTAFPAMQFIYKGVKVKVPFNYDPETRTYDGEWDGTFKEAKEWTDNPAWHLYDLWTNTEYGLGHVISEDDVDKWSFYSASVYNDEQVPAIVDGVISGTEPRFTFNYQFAESKSAFDRINEIASAMQAACAQVDNMVTLVQDRPASVSRMFTKDKVIGGEFAYTSTEEATRFTGAIVWWRDPENNYNEDAAYFEDPDLVERYGLNTTEITAIGCVSEGQALRFAKWVVYTSCKTTLTVGFKAGFNECDVEPGELIQVMDSDYSGVLQTAKIKSANASFVVLDRALTVAANDALIFKAADGTTILTAEATAGSSSNTIQYAGNTIPNVAFNDLMVQGVVDPMTFRVVTVKDEDHGQYSIAGQLYNPNKYAYVDDTPLGPEPTYAVPVSTSTIGPVTNVEWRTASSTNPDGTIARTLYVSWRPPSNALVKFYEVFISIDGAQLQRLPTTDQPVIGFPIDESGNYTATIYAINPRGVRSVGVEDTQYIDLDSETGSDLLPVTNLRVQKTGGNTFSGSVVGVTWDNPNVANANNIMVGQSYLVHVFESDGITLLRTSETANNTYEYNLSNQTVDGVRKRAVLISVALRDGFNRLTTATSNTFTNPYPAGVEGFEADGGVGSAFLGWTANTTETDVVSYVIHRGSSGGFTMSNSTVVAETSSTFFVDTGSILVGNTFYYKIFATDEFSTASEKNSGSNHNVTTSGAVTPITIDVGIPSGNSFPGAANTSDQFYRIDSKTLYTYDGTVWRAAGFRTVTSLPGSGDYADEVVVLSSDHKMYRWTGATWTASLANTDITGQIVETQIANNAISTPKIAAGAIVAGKIAANAVTANEIAAGSVTAGKVAANAITASEIAAGAVTTAKINAGAVTANEIATNAVIAAKIDAGAITTAKIAASAVTANEIAAGAVTTSKLSVISNNGVTIDMSSGRIVFDNGVVMLVEGTGFGSSNQFVMWFGPHQASVSTCTEVNATFYLKTNGSAYFGGSLSAGTLTTKASTSSLATNAFAETATFGSLGGTIQIAWSYGYGSTLLNFPYDLGTSSANANMRLYLKYGSNSYTHVDTINATGSHYSSPAGGGNYDNMVSVAGSHTYTDPYNTTVNRQYKAVMDNRSASDYTSLSGTTDQVLTVICTE